jgi:hypothetical protein
MALQAKYQIAPKLSQRRLTRSVHSSPKWNFFVMSYQLGLLGTKPVPQLLAKTKRKDLRSLLAGQKEACTVDGVMIADGTLL